MEPCGTPGRTDELELPPARPTLPPESTSRGMHPPVVARLAVVSGPDSGQVHLLSATTIRIGRDDENSIVLTDPTASRWHAEIRLRRGRYVLLDLDSGNGVRRNGRRVRRGVILVDGDEITLGETTLSFACSAARAVRDGRAHAPLLAPLLAAALAVGAVATLVVWWCAV